MWSGPYWSPDNEKFAVHNCKKGSFLSITDLQGNMEQFLSQEDVFPGRTALYPIDSPFDFGPVWSPNGKYVAFLTILPSEINTQLWLINTDTWERELAYEGKIGDEMEWSPDSKKILFQSSLQIYDIDKKTMNSLIIIKQPATWNFFTKSIWLPDNIHIVAQISPTWFNGYQPSGIEKGGLFIFDTINGEFKPIEDNAKGGLDEPIALINNGKGLIIEEDFDTLDLVEININN